MSCIRKPEDDDAVALRVSTVPATKPELSPIHAANPTAKMAVTGMSSAHTDSGSKSLPDALRICTDFKGRTVYWGFLSHKAQ